MANLTINGKRYAFTAPADMPLLWAIRDLAGLKGTKFGCGAGLCGACTVHLDGEPVRSCQTSLEEAAAGKITTIENVGTIPAGARIQESWREGDVPQCGYCQPGQIMSATALLMQNPSPTEQEISEAMEGNICRCGTYVRIREAINRAASA